jgi:excisionase family DNA binding protein
MSHSSTLLLSYKFAAERLGISARTLRRLVDAGELRPIRIGALCRFSPDELESFVAKRLASR